MKAFNVLLKAIALRDCQVIPGSGGLRKRRWVSSGRGQSSSRATKRAFLGRDRQPAVDSSAQFPDGADEPRFNRRPLPKGLTNPRLCKNFVLTPTRPPPAFLLLFSRIHAQCPQRRMSISPYSEGPGDNQYPRYDVGPSWAGPRRRACAGRQVTPLAEASQTLTTLCLAAKPKPDLN